MANLGNMYPNLPGMLVEFKDGGSALRFNEFEVATDSLLLLGTAIDGPIMEPVAVDQDTAELIFGSELKSNGAPNGSTLIHAFKQAVDAGCQDIRLMRISGSQAENKISAPSVVETSNKRIDEDLSVIQGNDPCEFTLSRTDINAATVKVLAKGMELSSGYTYNSSTNKVSLNKNACDAGSSILIKYEYADSLEAVPQTLTVNASNQIILSKPPIGTSVKIEKEGTLIPDTDYSVVGNAVTFTGTATKGDIVTVNFKYSQVGHGMESGFGSVPFIAATSEQTLPISDTPAANSAVLYIEGAKVLDTSAFKVDSEAKTVKIKKEKFQMGQPISISYYIVQSETVERDITLKSSFAGAIYNTGIVDVTDLSDSTGSIIGKSITITKPSSKLSTGELPQTYSSLDYPTFGDLVDAINANNSVYKAETKTPLASTDELVNSSSYFIAGDDGINLAKDQLFTKLSGERDSSGFLVTQGAYQLLENYQTDWVVPLGVYADDELADRHQNFAYELALFCAVISYRNKSTFGAISMKPLKDTTLAGIQKHAKYLAGYDNTYFMRDNTGAVLKDKDGEPIDLGKFISVIAGPEPLFNHRVNALREGNGAVMYTSFNTNLQAQSAPTNKKLEGSTAIKYSYSNAQLNDIVANNFVTFGTKFSRAGQALTGGYVIDAPTAARHGSEYARLTTLKVVREVSDNMREVAEPYIGEPNTIEQRNSLSAAISKRLDLLIEHGVILDYSFNLVATATDQALGQAKLELGIVAPQELRKITTVIGLKR